MTTSLVATSNNLKFIHYLDQMNDPRDNRGKRHELSFITASVVLAILSGKNQTSEIYRFIKNKIKWLKKILRRKDAKHVSRAQLPRILAVVDWNEANRIVELFFGIRIEQFEDKWVAIDGKSLRGTITDKSQAHEHEQIVTVVEHESQEILFQRKLSGSKDSEIVVVRDLLKETGLEKVKVSLDAHHLNPTTLGQIHQAGGTYLTQAKENQPLVLEALRSTAKTQTPIGKCRSADKGHGRIEEREGRFFSLQSCEFDPRWEASGLNILTVMNRIVTHVKKGTVTSETSYYVSNKRGEIKVEIDQNQQSELFNAIRNHWKVESNNYIRDVTFKEDSIKTKDKNQGQIMSLLRTVAIKFIRKTGTDNFKESIDSFNDSKKKLKKFIQKIGFI